MENFEKSSSHIERSPEPRLELEHRNPLQAEIIQQALGEDANNSNAVYEWAQENLERISNIIDAPEHEALRALSREGKYKEAAVGVIALLETHAKECKKIREKLTAIFEQEDEDELEGIYSEVRFFSPIFGLNADAIIEKIKKDLGSKNNDEKVAAVFDVIKIFVDKRVEYPETFKQAQRERALQRSQSIKISDLMSYNLDMESGVAILHVGPKEDLKSGSILGAFRQGMKELAKQAKNDERIREVRATSWIVASNPGLLERAGFTVEGLVDEDIKAEHFSKEERPVALAHMSRKTLLEKYATE